MKTKKILLSTACALFISMSAFSQEVAESDTVKSAENEKIQEEEKSSVYMDGKSYNFIFNWSKKSDNSIHAYSSGMGLTMLFLTGMKDVNYLGFGFVFTGLGFDVPINKHFVFATGLGDYVDGYYLKGNVVLKNDDDGITRFIRDNDRNYKSSECTIMYLTIPLLIEYQTKVKPNHTFFVSGGIDAMVKLLSMSETQIRTDEGILHAKHKGLNINNFNARCTLKTGFNFSERFILSLVGYYQPFSTFEKGKGVDVHPYGIGIMLDWGLSKR
ncbi:MAG: PorT family protein [Prevotellaceae bacterium]|jgi:hypothetical protein|nr:PorT family protein [Prevotellaceae bacterium]